MASAANTVKATIKLKTAKATSSLMATALSVQKHLYSCQSKVTMMTTMMMTTTAKLTQIMFQQHHKTETCSSKSSQEETVLTVQQVISFLTASHTTIQEEHGAWVSTQVISQ